jgi:hypothetical protein
MLILSTKSGDLLKGLDYGAKLNTYGQIAINVSKKMTFILLISGHS